MVKRNLILSKSMALGYRVADLAKELGINPSTLSSKLNGKRAFTVDEVESLRTILKLNQKDLIEIFFE